MTLKFMGQILETKIISPNKIHIFLELTSKEAQTLKNHAKKIHIFSENLCTHETEIIQRGAKMGTQYVLIPLSLKSRNKPRLSEILYQKIETKTKTFYIAIAKKTY
ncbi:hypothetical protein KAT36_02920 [Candidatus Pacearchaeota archaeon]|nr:hypothetical protein [Candidatus Pacearchaeota archaeon]